MRVKVPLRVGLFVGGALMEAHRIRERNAEKVVVTGGDALKDVREGDTLNFFQIGQGSYGSAADYQSFEGPNSPEWHKSNKVVVCAYEARTIFQFKSQIVGE